MVNKFAGQCSGCGTRVPAKGGVLRGSRGAWKVFHLACDTGDAQGRDGVVSITTSSGSYTQNRRGRCEDAPCCGCCTF